jgi:hypothetical protein
LVKDLPCRSCPEKFAPDSGVLMPPPPDTACALSGDNSSTAAAAAAAAVSGTPVVAASRVSRLLLDALPLRLPLLRVFAAGC